MAYRRTVLLWRTELLTRWMYSNTLFWGLGLWGLLVQTAVAAEPSPQGATDPALVTGHYKVTANDLLPQNRGLPQARAAGLVIAPPPTASLPDQSTAGQYHQSPAQVPNAIHKSPSTLDLLGRLDESQGQTGGREATVLPPSNPQAVKKTGPVLITQQSPQGETTPGSDPELGIIRVRSSSEDPELGILRIREQPVIPETPPQEPSKIGFFTARLTAASSDNILLDVGGLTGDEFLRPGLSLAFYPPVEPQTFLIGNIDASLQRYTTQSDFNYDDLRFRIGVRQGLFPRTYGQVLFTYQQLFRPGPPRFRFFENAAFSFTLGRRDPLTSRLILNSYYQVQLNDTEARSTPDGPTNFDDFDRLTQYLGGSLNYTINPQWLTGVSYQMTLADYTGQERYDTYHQLIGQLTYRITPDVRMSLYGGFSFGRSSDPRIQFNDTLFGVTLDATVPLF